MPDVKISIIIPTRNRYEKLNDTLKSLYNQNVDKGKWEVIVINNGSKDRTEDVCKSYLANERNFRYYYEAEPGLHVGRNKGLLESRGDIVAYLDDDVILFPNWLATVFTTFDDENVMAACGSVIPYDFNVIPEELWKYKIRINGFNVLLPISCFWRKNEAVERFVCDITPDLIIGANAIYRKRVLLECKGFHPDGMPKNMMMYRGDGETYIANWLLNKKAKVVYNPQMSVYHVIDSSRVDKKYIDYMFFRNGISSMYTCLRHSTPYKNAIKNAVGKITADGLYDYNNKHYIFGEIYLLIHFLFRSKIREWIKKDTYL